MAEVSPSTTASKSCEGSPPAASASPPDKPTSAPAKIRCDVCDRTDAHYAKLKVPMKMIQCTDCGVHVHRECYGIPTYIKDTFSCWACQAVGKTFTIHVTDKAETFDALYDYETPRVKMEVTQTTRPSICDLCSHRDDEVHAMHPVYDNYGQRARQLHIPDGQGGRRLVWAHTICGFFLSQIDVMYGVSPVGQIHIDDEPPKDEKDEQASKAWEDKLKRSQIDEDDDRSYNPELDSEDEHEVEEELYGPGISPFHHFVYNMPYRKRGELSHTKASRKIDNLKRNLTCGICKKNDTGKDVYRIPVQCSAGDRSEPQKFRVTHSDLFLDKGEACILAYHVGCARYYRGDDDDDTHNERRVHYFPGNDDSNPVSCLYCLAHASDIPVKNREAKEQEEEEKQQESRAKRKRAMAKYGTEQDLTVVAHVDDPSLSPLKRVKKDLAFKIRTVSKENLKTWIKEQKAFWAKRLSEEQLNEVWKPAKAYLTRTWNKMQDEKKERLERSRTKESRTSKLSHQLD